jgi:hypothetical protein
MQNPHQDPHKQLSHCALSHTHPPGLPDVHVRNPDRHCKIYIASAVPILLSPLTSSDVYTWAFMPEVTWRAMIASCKVTYPLLLISPGRALKAETGNVTTQTNIVNKIIRFIDIFLQYKTPHSFEKRGFNNLFIAPPLQKGFDFVVNRLTMPYSLFSYIRLTHKKVKRVFI